MDKIDIFALRNKTYLVFDLKQSLFLRESKRICSRLIGTQSNSSSQEQSTVSSVPLQLTLEELCLLIDFACQNDEINLLESIEPSNLDKIDKNNETSFLTLSKQFDSYLCALKQKQVDSYKKLRNQQLIAKKDTILDGKRKKLINQLDKIESSLAKLNDREQNKQEYEKLSKERLVIKQNLENLEINFNLDLEKLSSNEVISNETEIFVQTPEFYFENLIFEKAHKISVDKFKLLNSNIFETCKYKAFKYFWSNGFYITCGAKFGGDFLVYPGEPSKYHSQFILVCIEDPAEYNSISLKQLITYARMATTVKKTFVLASHLGFLSLNWSHI